MENETSNELVQENKNDDNTKNGGASESENDSKKVEVAKGNEEAQQHQDENKKIEEKSTENSEDNELKAPEKYEFKNENVAQEIKDAFAEVSRELDLSQENADKVLNKMLPVLEKRTAENLERVHTEWAEASKSDKEIGGEKLDENIKLAKKALKEFSTPELTNLLNDTSLGNHPEVIRLMSRIGKSISQDGFVGATGSTAVDTKPHRPNDREVIASTLYPQLLS